MQRPFSKIFRSVMTVLDRTPRATRGQSLLELSITTPIFFVMLLGLVEIGWAANNYLTLVDVSREAGRFGSLRDPILQWQGGLELTYQRMDCDEIDGSYNVLGDENPPLSAYPGPSVPGFSAGLDGGFLYFDSAACTVILQMQPVEFKNDEDDVVISVISYVITQNAAGVRRAVVTGRYPARSNECANERDPFYPPWFPSQPPADGFYDLEIDGRRGYMFRGTHLNEDNCLGSEFSIMDIEAAVNRTMLDSTGGAITADEIKEIPNNSVILVEIFFQNYQLLNLPFFTWIGNPIPMYVYSFFPVTAAEPTATH